MSGSLPTETDDPAYDESVQDITSVLSVAILIGFIAPTIKHPKFSSEKEWRVLLDTKDSGNAPQVRERKTGLTPYKVLPLKDNLGTCLSRVVVGPGPANTRERTAVRRLLDSHGLNHVADESSTVPFRTW